MVIVVDSGMGNFDSILNMLKKVGVAANVCKNSEDILQADKLILPGVGAFDCAVANLQKRGYIDMLNQKVLIDKTPILGICLGMQLFSKQSEEGRKPGLGWLDAQTVRFRFDGSNMQTKVPHMGWNTVRVRQNSPFFVNPDLEHRFYFVHSFHVQCNNPADILTSTHYGLEFTSAICHENILGTQFHPEKSHRFGLSFFNAFVNWIPSNVSVRQS